MQLLAGQEEIIQIQEILLVEIGFNLDDSWAQLLQIIQMDLIIDG